MFILKPKHYSASPGIIFMQLLLCFVSKSMKTCYDIIEKGICQICFQNARKMECSTENFVNFNKFKYNLHYKDMPVKQKTIHNIKHNVTTSIIDKLRFRKLISTKNLLEIDFNTNYEIRIT